jgi:fructokinase
MQLYRKSRDDIGGRRPRIVGTGLVALDVLGHSSRDVPGTALGGSVGNVLAILGHLGWHCVPVAELGLDNAAEKIRTEFASLGADLRFLRGNSLTSTPVVFQLPGTGGATHEFSFSCPVCGRKRGYSPPSCDVTSTEFLADISAPNVFFFDRVNTWALNLAERYRKAGTLVVFEPSLVGGDSEAFERAIQASHILKYADDRISDLARFELGSVDIEIRTLGKRGLEFRQSSQPDQWHSLSAFHIPFVADTAGAGDWCTSGFLYSLIDEIFEHGGAESISTLRVRESLRIGQALAALNCMEIGARGLARSKSRDEIVHLAASLNDAGANLGQRQDRPSKTRATLSKFRMREVVQPPLIQCCAAVVG